MTIMTKDELCRHLKITYDQYHGFANTYININKVYMLEELPEGFSPIISQSLDLGKLKIIPKGFSPLILYGDLYLDSIEYWPKGFKLHVRGKIYLKKLKSKILMTLILNPGSSRQLAYNIINNL